jgi:sulfur carrier protein
MSKADTTSASIAGTSKTIVLNGERRVSRAATLAEVLAEAGYGDARIATAVNGDFVPERRRAATAIADGDRIEVVSPRQGG